MSFSKRPGRPLRRGDAARLDGKDCWLGSKAGAKRVVFDFLGANTGRMVPDSSSFFPALGPTGHYNEELASLFSFFESPLRISLLTLQIDTEAWIGSAEVRVGEFLHWTGPLSTDSKVHSTHDEVIFYLVTVLIGALLRAVELMPQVRRLAEDATFAFLALLPPDLAKPAWDAGATLMFEV